MRAAPPEEFESSPLIDCLTDGWGLEVEAVHYAAVGGGSYHWIVNDVEGARAFVTADDLDHKPWLGGTRESAFVGLSRAFDTAVALHEGGLGFVVAPTRTKRGDTVRRFGSHHTVALFPFVAGQAGTFGPTRLPSALLCSRCSPSFMKQHPWLRPWHAKSTSICPAVAGSRQRSKS